MARISNDEDTTAPSSWLGWKERGKVLFNDGNFEGALNAYTQGLRPEYHCPPSEQQLLWSNIVACRLAMASREGGSLAQAEAALEAAKKCVAINDSWAKGHIRLATALIAVGGHSNDACNELQRALQLDPGNPLARDLLVKELRRDRVNRNNVNNGSNGTSPPPSAPAEDLDDQDYPPRRDRAQQQTPHTHYYEDIDTGVLSWAERFQFYLLRAKHWYLSQNDDIKAILKVFLGLVILYVAFGGRFGLEYLTSPTTRVTGSLNNGRNAYSDFYQERRQHQAQEQSRSRYYDPYAGRYNDYGGGDPYYPRSHSSQRRSNVRSFGGGDGNVLVTLLVTGAIVYVAQRNGINPLQALFFANMAMGGRGRGRRFGPGGMMMGGGFGHRGGWRRRW